MPRPPPPAVAFTTTRVADARGKLGRLRRVLDHAFAPRRDRHARRGRDLLGGDLVAEPAHRLGRGAEEADAGRGDALDEARVLGDEAPAGPDRVGAGAPQRVEQPVVVEVGRDLAARGVEPLDGVGVAHEGRVAIHVGVERDHPQLGALVRAQRLHGADAAHRGLAAVHDREPVDRLEDVHVAPRPGSRLEGRGEEAPVVREREVEVDRRRRAARRRGTRPSRDERELAGRAAEMRRGGVAGERAHAPRRRSAGSAAAGSADSTRSTPRSGSAPSVATACRASPSSQSATRRRRPRELARSRSASRLEAHHEAHAARSTVAGVELLQALVGGFLRRPQAPAQPLRVRRARRAPRARSRVKTRASKRGWRAPGRVSGSPRSMTSLPSIEPFRFERREARQDLPRDRERAAHARRARSWARATRSARGSARRAPARRCRSSALPRAGRRTAPGSRAAPSPRARRRRCEASASTRPLRLRPPSGKISPTSPRESM